MSHDELSLLCARLARRQGAGAALALVAAIGCGGKTTVEVTVEPADTRATPDAALADTSPPDVRDSSVRESSIDAPTEVSADVSPAAVRTKVGEPCSYNIDCGAGYQCLQNFVRGGLCTRTCDEDPSELGEQLQCGSQATCVSWGDPPYASSYCEKSCDATAAETGCRPGFMCTGWWFTHADGSPDRTGCWTFCSSDAHCPAGQKCNVRTGFCSRAGTDLTKKPDGEPCTPTPTESFSSPGPECRGACLYMFATSYTEGVCASRVDTTIAARCPDDPDHVLLAAPPDDDNGLCWLRSCSTDCDCTAPLRCLNVLGAAARFCQYPLVSEQGVPCADAGPGDSGTD